MTSTDSIATSDLVHLLYRATIDDSALVKLLERLAVESRTHTVAILVQDRLSPENSQFISNRPDPQVSECYAQNACDNIFLQAAKPYLTPGTVVRINTELKDTELLASPFYTNFCQDRDIHHCMIVTLRVDDHMFVELTFNREKEAPFTREDQEWLERLAPHLDSFISIRRKVDGIQLSNDASWALLDLQNYGVQVFDEYHRPLYANKALKHIVELSSLLSWCDNQLTAKSPALSNWITQGRQELQSSAKPRIPRVMREAYREEKYHFMLAPLYVHNHFIERNFSVLFVSDINGTSSSVGAYLMQVYDLTHREMDVAELLVQGLSTREIAATLNVATSTVSTHKKNIFEKTEVHKQSELIRIALALNLHN